MLYSELLPNWIRLVNLFPGQWDQEICLKLYSSFLANRPHYKALSYVWGSPKNMRPVYVNGSQVFITRNLELALRRLRQTHGTLTLWVDALCINQNDLAERTQQVQLMRHIFAHSNEVIIYLGEIASPDFLTSLKNTETETTFVPDTEFHCNDGDLEKVQSFQRRCTSENVEAMLDVDYGLEIFCFIRLLAEGLNVKCTHPFWVNFRPDIDSKYQRDLFEALRMMVVHSRWWNRAWVIQEIVVPEKVIVRYGSMLAPWNMFVQAANVCTRNRHASIFSSFPRQYLSVLALYSQRILGIQHMRVLWRKGEKIGLLHLLRQFSGRKATDDRDKVYALLSLTQDKLSIVPDYSLPVSRVFQNALLGIVERTGSLAALTGDLGRKNRHDLPSWVPDWSAAYDDVDRLRYENTKYYNKTLGSRIYVQYHASEEYSGISTYLNRLLVEYNEKNGTLLRFDSLQDYSMVLGTLSWAELLKDPHREHSDKECLEAIESLFIAQGGPVCLRDHGHGLISIPGFHVDTVAVTGETLFSFDGLVEAIQSWGTLAAEHFQCQTYRHTEHSLGDAFRRTLCADMISLSAETGDVQYRRICASDGDVIAAWFLNGHDSPYGAKEVENSRELGFARDILFGDLRGHTSNIRIDQSESIYTAVQTATYRRKFFISEEGYIGLGPAKMRAGDYLYILPGGATPFILRNDGSRRVKLASHLSDPAAPDRVDLEVMGDCYAHGLMDGEAMHKWKKATVERLQVAYQLDKTFDRWIWEASKLTRCEWDLQEAEKELQEDAQREQNVMKKWRKAIRSWQYITQESRKQTLQCATNEMQSAEQTLIEAAEKWLESGKNQQNQSLQRAEEELQDITQSVFDAKWKRQQAMQSWWKATQKRCETAQRYRRAIENRHRQSLQLAKQRVHDAEQELQEAAQKWREAAQSQRKLSIKEAEWELEKAADNRISAMEKWKKAVNYQSQRWIIQTQQHLEHVKQKLQGTGYELNETKNRREITQILLEQELQWAKQGLQDGALTLQDAQLALQRAEQELQSAEQKLQTAKERWRGKQSFNPELRQSIRNELQNATRRRQGAIETWRKAFRGQREEWIEHELQDAEQELQDSAQQNVEKELLDAKHELEGAEQGLLGAGQKLLNCTHKWQEAIERWRNVLQAQSVQWIEEALRDAEQKLQDAEQKWWGIAEDRQAQTLHWAEQQLQDIAEKWQDAALKRQDFAQDRWKVIQNLQEKSLQLEQRPQDATQRWQETAGERRKAVWDWQDATEDWLQVVRLQKSEQELQSVERELRYAEEKLQLSEQKLQHARSQLNEVQRVVRVAYLEKSDKQHRAGGAERTKAKRAKCLYIYLV